MSRFAFVGLVVWAVACSVELAPVESSAGGAGASSGAGGAGAGGAGGSTAGSGGSFGGSGGSTPSGGAAGAGGTAALGGAAGAGAGAGAGGTGGTGDPCVDCTQSACAAPQAACSNTPQCGGLGACLASCGNPSCQDGCYAANSDGFTPFYALRSCVYTSCPVECGIVDAQCHACESSSCAGPRAACLGSYECLAFWQCSNTCSSVGCFDYCASYFPTGVQQSDAFDNCSQSYCTGPCGW